MYCRRVLETDKQISVTICFIAAMSYAAYPAPHLQQAPTSMQPQPTGPPQQQHGGPPQGRPVSQPQPLPTMTTQQTNPAAFMSQSMTGNFNQGQTQAQPPQVQQPRQPNPYAVAFQPVSGANLTCIRHVIQTT